MRNKILKIQLFGLFILTIVSFLEFYFRDSLPDNYLSISSINESINIISYFFSSLVGVIGFYTGPWIFLPFLLFTITYAFLISRRNYFFDICLPVFLTVFFAILSYFVFPKILGFGLYSIFKNYNLDVVLFLIMISFFIFYVVTLFQNQFKEKIVLIFKDFASKSGVQQSFGVLEICKRKYLEFYNLIATKLRGSNSLNLKIKALPEKIVISDSFTSGDQGATTDEIDINSQLDIYENDKGEDLVDDLGSTHTVELKDDFEDIGVQPLKRKISNYDTQDYIDSISLGHPPAKQSIPANEYFDKLTNQIQEKLQEFKVEGKIVEVLKGPVVDTFLLELGKGLKVSKVTSIIDELSAALYGELIRIHYPMKGRTSVGIEVPRRPRETIFLDEVLSMPKFKETELKLPIAMGKDTYGDEKVVDLSDMPHMLVAGSTGSGKSVFINTLLVSLLVKKSPDDLKLVLIDPKQLELAPYAKLPHLALPVITEAKKASVALLWAVQEMERRYSILKNSGVRNLDSFNLRLASAEPEMLASIQQFYPENEENFALPYIVIIVDEFADLILSKYGESIETNICRLAGMARAAGIHLVIATQRPSVDVITGIIKANFPTRVSFKVISAVDSRTILNAMGAERLLGKGDMLYRRGVETMRVHSAYIGEDEIEELVKRLSVFGQEYNASALEFLESDGESGMDKTISMGFAADDGGGDDIYNKAVQLVIEHRSASASMLQRKLSIGFPRAGSLIDRMEKNGIVGPADGSRPRKVLVLADGSRSDN